MDGLIVIIADMLRSAVNWEEENGQLPKFKHENILTSISQDYKLTLLQNPQRGENDEHVNNNEKQQP